MDRERLFAALASRLQAVVPEGYRVIADGDNLYFGGHGSSSASPVGYALDAWTPTAGDEHPSPDDSVDRDPLYAPVGRDEVIAAVAFKALDELQDLVDESSREPWPGARQVPLAGAAVREGVLYMWYGDAASPVLKCEPLPLGEFED